MRALYEAAAALTKATGIPHHVDHVVPILAKEACGLHVPWNLVITTRAENYSRNNRMPDDPRDHIALA